MNPPLRPADALKREDWFTDVGVRAVFAALDGEKGATRIVGGAVRNALIGKPVEDIDFATRLIPDTVIERVEAAGGRAVPTGIEHGTITTIFDGRPFEVTTLRRDVETDGRHAVVAFSDSFEEDADRRDFTINALAIDAMGVVHDSVGGLDDLAARRLRFIGDPNERIKEDYLRILRYFRFFAHFGEVFPDSETRSALVAHRAGLSKLSAERIGAEMMKLLCAPDPTTAIDLVAGLEIDRFALGAMINHRTLAALVDAEIAFAIESEPVRRLVALVDAERDVICHLQDRLRLSNRDYAHMVAIADAMGALASGQTRKAAIYAFGNSAVLDALLVSAAQSRRTPLRDDVDLARHWSAPAFPLSGRDLMNAGLAAGPAIGEALDRAKSAWINDGFTRTRDDLLKIALKESA